MEILEGLKDFQIVKLTKRKPQQIRNPITTSPKIREAMKTERNKTGTIKEIHKNKHNLIQILNYSNATPIRRHSDLGYACCFCPDNYIEPTDLKIHTIEEHFDTEQDLKYKYCMSDLLVKLDITSLQCKICKEYIDSIETLKEHLIDHGKQLYMDIKNYFIPFKFDDDGLKCVTCRQEFGVFKALLEHSHSHYRNFVCDYCDAGFTTPKILRRHSATHKFGVFECKSCGKILDTEVKLKMHERSMHSTVKIMNCALCAQRFGNYAQKRKHLIEVHGMQFKSVECKVCFRSFPSDSHLDRHTRKVHLLERPHRCPHCEKAFFHPGILKEHLTTHMEDVYFQCAVCSRRFSSKANLRRHVKKHMEDRDTHKF